MPSPFEFLVVLLAMSKALVLVGGGAASIYFLIWSAAATTQHWRIHRGRLPGHVRRRSTRTRHPQSNRSLDRRHQCFRDTSEKLA
jgi:hypothetical protein